MTKLPANLASVRAVKDERQAYKLHWAKSEHVPKARTVLMDGFTASAIIAVHDAAKPEMQTKIAELISRSPHGLLRVANACFKCVK